MSSNPIELIDIGVNLTSQSLLHDVPGLLQRAQQVGVTKLVVTGTDLESSEQAIALCRQFTSQLVSTCGVHPHHASEWSEQSYKRLQALAKTPCVRAIGETGLDFNRNYSARDAQELAFLQQMELATELGMPLFCHQRDAHQRFLELLLKYRDRVPAVVVHCFTDNHQALLDYLEIDCHIGITGWVCDERRGLELQKLVKLVPSNRIMLETDAPYLLPRDLEPKPASRVNQPAYLPHILQKVAKLRNQDPLELAQDCLRNSKAFFKID